MRKITYIILFLLCSLAASAQTVSSETAARKASEFFGNKTVTLAWSGDETKTSALAAPAFYAFNNADGGWVIIAGDSRCEPVIAYSNEGSFNASKLPSNFKAWMKGIDKNINAVRNSNSPRKAAMTAKWASAPRKATSQTLLTTATWGQGSPYYNLCPSNSATGCVATAMAIVMRYHQYPTKGTGTIPAYTTETNKYSIPAINVGSTTYDWANMPLSYSSSATSAQKTAVATLMYHCGASVQMDYDPEGSGAYSCDIPVALYTYFGYSKNSRELYRSNYSNNDWMTILKKEIDANQPVIYGGSDVNYTDSGHQFVIDGYNSDNMVHVNWGWDGQCNAWYAVCYLGDTSSSGVDGVFSYYDTAIVGVVPDAAGTSTGCPELCLESDSSQDLYGITLASGSIAKNTNFTLDLGFICNYDYYNNYTGSYKVGLFSYDGTLKQYIGSEISASIEHLDDDGYPGYTYSENYSCKITCDIALGDYIQVVYKQADGSFAPMGGYRSDDIVSREDNDEYYTNCKVSALDISMLVVPTSPKAGEVLYFELIPSYKTLPASIKWYWDNSVINTGFVKMTSGKHTIKASVTYDSSNNTTETLQKVVNVQ